MGLVFSFSRAIKADYTYDFGLQIECDNKMKTTLNQTRTLSSSLLIPGAGQNPERKRADTEEYTREELYKTLQAVHFLGLRRKVGTLVDILN